MFCLPLLPPSGLRYVRMTSQGHSSTEQPCNLQCPRPNGTTLSLLGHTVSVARKLAMLSDIKCPASNLLWLRGIELQTCNEGHVSATASLGAVPVSRKAYFALQAYGLEGQNDAVLLLPPCSIFSLMVFVDL